MRILAVLVLAMAHCGPVSSAEMCPTSEPLSAWIYPSEAAVSFSSCGRVAEFTGAAASKGLLRYSRQSDSAKTVTLSARFELLQGAGRFEVYAGKERGPIVSSTDSGPLSVTGEFVSGRAEMSLIGIAAADKSMKWRVSDVRIDEK